MESKAVEQKFTQTELQAVKAELAEVKESNAIKDDRMHQMDAMIHKLQQDFANLTKAMGTIPTVSETKLALKRKAGCNRIRVSQI